MRCIWPMVVCLVCVLGLMARGQTDRPNLSSAGEAESSEPTLLVGRFEVVLRDGRRFECDRVERLKDTVELSIGNARVRFAIHQIFDIRELPSVEVAYLRARSELSDDDLAGRYKLAYDLYKAGHRDLALRELDEMRERFPDSHRVTTLHTLLHEQVDSEERARRVDKAAEALDRSVPKPQDSLPNLILTPEQISLVRLWEQPHDMRLSRPQVRIDRDVMEEVFQAFEGHPALPASKTQRAILMRGPGYERLQLLFDLEARAYYPRVEVFSDPPAIKVFLGIIRPGYHGRHFARYFGGGVIDGLPISTRGLDPAAAYADFVTLSSAKIDGMKVIDRAEPEMSLYLQWGLPRDQADYPAPDVPGWRPYFHSRDDRVYRFVRDWIESLYDFRTGVDYGFSWPLDGALEPETDPGEAETAPSMP